MIEPKEIPLLDENNDDAYIIVTVQPQAVRKEQPRVRLVFGDPALSYGGKYKRVPSYRVR